MDYSDTALALSTEIQERAATLRGMADAIEAIETAPEGAAALSDRLRAACDVVLSASGELLAMVDEIDAAEYVEPPPPPPPHEAGTLEAAFIGLQPGQVSALAVEAPPGGFRIQPASGGTYSIIDWTPRDVWSQKHRTYLHAGKRKGRRLIQWRDAQSDWRDPPQPPEWSALENESTGHAYGLCAYDGDDHVFALGTVFNIADWTFAPIPPAPAGTMGYTCVGPLLAAYGVDGGFGCYDRITNTWLAQKSVRWLGHGQHAHLEYNPALNMCLLAGGNPAYLRDPTTGERLRDATGAFLWSTSKRMTVLDMSADQPTARQITDCPQTLVMSKGAFVVPHPSQRCWIVRGDDEPANPARMWACWPERVGNEWQDLGPAAHIRGPVAVCAQHDGLVLTRADGLYAYRLPTL